MIYTLWVHIPSFPEKGFITGSNDLQDSIQSFRIERNSSVVKVLGIDQSVAQKIDTDLPLLCAVMCLNIGDWFGLSSRPKCSTNVVDTTGLYSESMLRTSLKKIMYRETLHSL
ncbi:hypothetical protein Tco_0013442 [Tanacetum coccineum]